MHAVAHELQSSDGTSALRTLDPLRLERSIVTLDARLRESRPSEAHLPGGTRVSAIHLPQGRIDAAHLMARSEDDLGLLLLGGLVLVELSAGRAKVGWLTGAGDLLRPWELDDIWLTRATEWRVLTPARIAVLDGDFARQVNGLRGITHALLAHATQTSHWLLAKSLVASAPVVEEKLLLLFALYGERWGRVTAEGVLLDLPLTHSLLAALCGTRRPTVTTALQTLEREDLVARSETGGWLLRRPPGGGVPRASCWTQYASALGLA